MAKQKHTTSTPRPATAAKATLATAETLCRLEDEGFAEVENLRHLSALMALWGDHVSSPGKGWTDMEMQVIGLRIEALAEMVKRHAELCGRAWMDVRTTAERMTKAGAQ
jgi:hypothetical protein